ncbi:MAG: MFS transporter [bacterium]|nr:MFS transporter [bacterium]
MPGTDGTSTDRRLRPFFFLWGGQAVSLLGSQAVQFALIWWLTEQTGSATVLATASILGLLPPVVLGPLIGPWIDRSSRRRVMALADGGVALLSAALALLFLRGGVGVNGVYAFLLLRAVGGAFQRPAMEASTSLMVPREHLSRIQGLNQTLQGGMLIASAPLGALLLAALPMAGVLLVDVVTMLAAVVPLIFVAVPRPDSATPGERPSWRADVAEGLRYLAGRRGHLAIVGLAASTNLFLTPAFALLPLLVFEHLEAGAGALGGITSSFGIGSIVGGLLIAVWGGFRRRILTALAGMVGLGVATLSIAALPSGAVLGCAIAVFAVGAMVTITNAPIQAVLQATIDPSLQGRVFSLFGSLAALTAPLGLVLAAPIAEWIGVRAWFVLGGGVCLSCGLLSFLIPAVTRIEEPGPRVAAAGDAIGVGPSPG